ncbi:MAG: glutaredoxin family protein [Gemmataceae bacterium]
MFWSWWKRKPLADLFVVMYTRDGCHLCDEAWETLGRWQRKYGFVMHSVDVDTDSELRERYGMTVPVITVDGQVRFRGRVNDVLFKRLLDAEVRRQNTS